MDARVPVVGSLFALCFSIHPDKHHVPHFSYCFALVVTRRYELRQSEQSAVVSLSGVNGYIAELCFQLSACVLITCKKKKSVSSLWVIFWSDVPRLPNLSACSATLTHFSPVYSGEFISPRMRILQPLFYEIIDFQSCQNGTTLPSSALADTRLLKGF